VAAIEVTPALGSERLLTGHDIDAVINLVGAGSWLPYRLAARLRAPVLVTRPEDEETSRTERDVIGMLTATGRDVALSHVTVRPEEAGSGSLTIQHGAEPLTVPDGWCTITIRDHQLEITVGRSSAAESTFASTQAKISASGTEHRLVRDELPISELDGELTLTADPGGLIVHRV
jgi:hypothetical protein